MVTGLYPPELRSTNLDFDWVYRKFFPYLIGLLKIQIRCHERQVRHFFMTVISNSLKLIDYYYGHDSKLARTLPVGSMVFWAVALLGLFLILYLSG